jgi:hypothetical protein
MFSRRWSTFTLLNFILVVALMAFLAGRGSMLRHSRFSENAPRPLVEENRPMVLSRPEGMIHSAQQPRDENLEDRWNELRAQPATPDGESEMAALIEAMARRDPQRAISLATAQINVRLRAALLRAALKGWGTTDPEAAAAWAQTETVMDQAQAMDALLQGAVGNPDKAVALTTALIQNNAAQASEFGTDLISALNESGQFAAAANFAVNGPENCRNDWILPAYSRWAEFQPQAAVAGAMQISDPGVRDAALNAIVTGWAPTDPQGLVEFAQNNLSGAQQNAALESAIGFWADSDPMAAAQWINQNSPGSQADNGIAQIALSSQLSQSPELAANWAESISSSQLRMDTLTSVFSKWIAADSPDAESYIENSPALTQADRTQLLAQLKNQFGP